MKITPYTERHRDRTAGYKSDIWYFLIWKMTISTKAWDGFKENPKSIMELPPHRLPHLPAPAQRHLALNYSHCGSLLPCHGNTQTDLWEARVIREETWASCQWPCVWTTQEVDSSTLVRPDSWSSAPTACPPPHQRPKPEPKPAN